MNVDARLIFHLCNSLIAALEFVMMAAAAASHSNRSAFHPASCHHIPSWHLHIQFLTEALIPSSCSHLGKKIGSNLVQVSQASVAPVLFVDTSASI